ncbi:MAG TPA: tetratricopeptide repeat protein [Xenococcaceae cyanobacterium]
MLRWIEQKFNKGSANNSTTDSPRYSAVQRLSQLRLHQEPEQPEAVLTSDLDLTDGDYEFLFNQLLEGIAHGWHQARIAKFFHQLEARGELEPWVSWLQRFYQKFPASPSPIQRQLGARMMRLGELTQSHPQLQKVGVVAHEIGRKLFFGDIAALIWEYDGADLISTSNPESEVTAATTSDSPKPTTADYSTVIQDGIISDNLGELSLDTEEFPLINLSLEDSPVIVQDTVISEQSAEEALTIAQDTSDDNSEEFLLTAKTEPSSTANSEAVDNTSFSEAPDEIESPWEQPELIASIPELPISKTEPQSPEEDSATTAASKAEIASLPLQSSSQNVSVEQFIDLLKQDQNLTQQISEQFNISSSDPKVIIQTAIAKLSNLEQSSLNQANAELLESWFDLGIKQASAGEFENAIASWNKVLEFNPELAEVWHNRGSALGRLGKYSESIESFDRALIIEPNHYQAWNDRAHALYLMERWQEAIESWDRAISIMPNNYQFWYNRGRALEQLKLIEESIANYEKALEIQPGFAPARSRYLNLLADK